MGHAHRITTGIAFALALGGAAPAHAQAWPAKPLHVIVPNATSGLPDIVARLVAARLADVLGQQVLVENRPGAGGTLGTAAAARAASDGYTLLCVFDSHASNPHLFRSLPYDTLADFAPVALLVRGPLVLVVRPGLGAASVAELVALARSKPGAINFASVGPGSPARLLMELLQIEGGISVTNIAYKGAGLALADLVGGQVDAMFATVPSIRAHWKAGRVRALAVTSARRGEVAPGVPAMSESFPGFVAESWVGMLAPAKTPNDIVLRLNGALLAILAGERMRERFAEQGLETAGGTPEQFDRWIRAESERWGGVIRAQHIVLE